MKKIIISFSIALATFFFTSSCRKSEDMDLSFTISGTIINPNTYELYDHRSSIQLFGTRKRGVYSHDTLALIETIQISDKGRFSFEYDKFLTDKQASDIETFYLFFTKYYDTDEKLMKLDYNKNYSEIEIVAELAIQ